MRESIAWHEECLKNQMCTIDRYKEEEVNLLARVENLKASISELEKSTTFYQKQITTAKIRFIDEFDRERFLVKKGDKGK